MIKRWFPYVLTAVFVSMVVFLVEVWAINWRFLFTAKLVALLTTIDSFRESFPLSSQVSIVMLAILAGIYVSLLLFHLRNHYKMQKAAGLGVAGSVFGSLGVGCGACGSVVLSSFFGAGTTAAFLTLLPFKGVEFSGIGIVILAIAILILIRQLRKPLVCKN